MKRFLVLALVFALGATAGGWFFAGTRWRPFLVPAGSGSGLKAEELLGLVGSIAVRKAPRVLPDVVMTTKYSVAFVSPWPEARTHIVVVPRRDIKDMADLRRGDEPYVIDAIAVAGRIARLRGLRHWQFFTRGPEAQAVRYLHFHLVSNEGPAAPRPGR
jgi:diadenosine tetraphosphate (Ap4A) HIT family hydrolase